MRAHLSNAAYGILDYGAYPIGMLVVAPVMLRNLGVGQYGVLALATAAVSIGGIIASVSAMPIFNMWPADEESATKSALLRAVRSMMGINLVLGVAFALIGWMVSPLAAVHMTAADVQLRQFLPMVATDCEPDDGRASHRKRLHKYTTSI